MNLAQRTAEWIFRTHTPETLLRWAETLRYTYFFRAVGGHANDGDQFQLSLSFSDPQDLQKLLAQMNVKQTLSPEGFWTSVQEIPVFLSIHDSILCCSFLGADGKDMHGVSEKDLQNAVAFEQLIETFGWKNRVDRTTEADPQCMTKKRILAYRA